uniref:Dynein axonemal assembly factor 4 n=1 Tax=Phallusia mammillata TaxID=59560 RepID=A0A6F9DAH7_9ASCI|nr:EKN1 protein [Phallusia mammillata]
MPIVIKDFRWHETKDKVTIVVPLKGVKSSKVDIFATEEYIKVSYPPFLFECVLYAGVDDDKSVATIRDGCVTFSLPKQEPEIWTQLQSSQAGDKAFVLKKKQEAIENAQKKNEKAQKERASIKDENKKFSMREMMKVEEEDKSRIEQTKESERLRTVEELNKWKDVKRMEAEQEKLQIIQERWRTENSGCTITELDDEEEIKTVSNKIELQNKEIFKENTMKQIQVESTPTVTKPQKPKEDDPRKPSGPRQTGKIAINFTPRVFPTPQRESKKAEEDEWLQKQAAARKRADIDDPDLAEHEKDPVWLKDKAGSLFAAGNYAAAVNAYNLAIRIQPKMPILYVNRAACQLKLRNLYKCVEDSSTALDLMTPAVDGNAKGRLKAHLRRAAAFSELELYVEALQDYEAAIKIDPKNENLRLDADKLRQVIQSSDG